MARLPDMFADEPDALRATGTSDNVAVHGQEQAQRRAQQSGRESMHLGAKPCDSHASQDGLDDEAKELQIAGICDSLQPDASECERADPPGVEPGLIDMLSMVLASVSKTYQERR